MRIVPALLAFLLSLTPAMAARHALIIGNAEYSHLSRLQNTIADATAYAQAYENLGYRVMIKTDLNEDDMADALDAFVAGVAPGDSVAFVFSGHGWSDGKSNYLIPTDAPKQGSDRKLRRKSMELRNGRDGVLDVLESAGASLVFAVIDACRDFPFQPTAGTRSAGISRGLARVDPPIGTYVVYSAGNGQQALDRLPSDGPDQKLSVFTRHFVPLLQQGADLRKAVQTARMKTAQDARSFNGHQQFPAVYDQVMRSDICFGGPCAKVQSAALSQPKPTARPAAQVQRRSQCDLLYEKAESVGACFGYEAYLSACGDHLFAPFAQSFVDKQCVAAVTMTPDTDPLVLACDAGALASGHPDIKAGKTESQGIAYRDINPKTAIPACEKAVEAYPDHWRSVTNLGRALDKAERYVKAAATYQRAVDNGDPVAMNNLAESYYYGTGVEQSDQTAFELYARGADAGLSQAQNNLGLMYDRGRGVAEDDAQAVRWYRAAADLGNSDGQNNLGAMYEDGTGVGHSYDQARVFYRRSADQGNFLGQRNLARLYDLGLGVAEDDAQAAVYYRKAADQGDAYSQNSLASLYQEGSGVAQDNAEAMRLYRAAAEQDYAAAVSNVGWMHEMGNGVAVNMAEALKYYNKAAELGSANAMTNLGYMYETGKGVKEDLKKTLELYQKAVDLGHIRAMNNLGVLYELGKGVPKNPQKAAELYMAALKGGSTSQIDATSSSWDRATARALQRLLKAEGVYSGKIDGSIGPGTKDSMRKLLP